MISKRVLIVALALVAFSAPMSFGANVIGEFNLNHFWNGGLVDLTSHGITKVDTSTDQGATLITPPYEGMRQQLEAGFNGFGWDGTAGVTNSSAASSAVTAGIPLYAIGLQTVDEYKNFFGHASFFGVDVSSVSADTWALTQYTYMGDADLNGLLNGDDYYYLDTSIDYVNNGSDPPVISWANGDFDFNGVINGDDFYWIDSVMDYANANWGGATPELPVGFAAAAAVPEPATFVLVILALGCFLGFRKVRK
jgi:hypothetical protein